MNRAKRLKKARTTGRTENVHDLLTYCQQEHLALPAPPETTENHDSALALLSDSPCMLASAPAPEPSRAMLQAGYTVGTGTCDVSDMYYSYILPIF